MIESQETTEQTDTIKPAEVLVKWAGAGWEALTSIKLFLVLVPLLLIAFIAGTIIPQDLTGDQLYERYGHFLARFLEAIRLNDVFHAAWFNALLAFLGLNLAACSIRRIKAVAARPGVFMAHIGILLILAGALVRGAFGRKGTLPMFQGEMADKFYLPDGRRERLPFQVYLSKFWLEHWNEPSHELDITLRSNGARTSRKVRVGETLALDGASLEVASYYPDFYLNGSAPQNRSAEPRNPALEIIFKRGGISKNLWVFANFPGVHGERFEEGNIAYRYEPGRIRQFNSTLDIYDGAHRATGGTINVNNPISFKGYTIYQYSYDPANPNYSSFLVTKDPGTPLVYAAFILLSAGLVWNFRWRRHAPLGLPSSLSSAKGRQ